MAQGSRVTYTEQPISRQSSCPAAASAKAIISACASGSPQLSLRLWPRPTTTPSRTTTAPTGTSPAVAATRAIDDYARFALAVRSLEELTGLPGRHEGTRYGRSYGAWSDLEADVEIWADWLDRYATTIAFDPASWTYRASPGALVAAAHRAGREPDLRLPDVLDEIEALVAELDDADLKGRLGRIEDLLRHIDCVKQ